MTTSASRPVALDSDRDHSILALVLGVLAVPGSTIAWDYLPGGGFVWGTIPAVAAIVLGARSRHTSPGRSWTAIVLGAAMLLLMTVWSIVEIVAG